jgi:MFS family permease
VSQFAILLTLQFSFGIAFSTFLLLPKMLAVYLHAGPAGVGLINSTFAAAGVAAIPFVGARVDRPGRPRLIRNGSLLMVVSALAYIAVDHVGVLAVALRALHGVAYAVVFVVGAAVAGDLAPPGAMSRTIALYGSSNLVTNAVAPLVVEPLVDRWGPTAAYVVAATGALIAFVLGRRLEDRPHEHDAAQGSVSLSVVFRRPRAQRVMAAFALGGIALGTMFNFGLLFALSVGINEVRSYFIAYTIVVLAVRFLLRNFIDDVGPQRATVASLLLYAVVVFSMRFLGKGPFTLWSLGAGLGVAHGVLFPAIMALSVTDLPAQERGRMLTLTNGAFIGGNALVAPLGPLAASVGYPSVFALGAVCALAGAALLARWPVAGPRAVP